MYHEHTIAAVVTAYNEEGLVGNVIDKIPSFVDHVYAIDDCSTDGTWEEILSRKTTHTQPHMEAEAEGAEAMEADGGQSEPTVIPIQHEENQGVGGAIKTGYKIALQNDIDITAVINGDGQMDPGILSRFVDPIASGTADYVKGNRLYTGGHAEEMSTWRLSGNAILTFLTKITSGYWKMNDPQNGYTAISLNALRRIDISSLYDDYGFLNDLLVHLNVHNLRIADVEMKAKYGQEESGIKYHQFVPKLSFLLLSRFLWRLKHKYIIRDFHPLVLMYLLGTIGLSGAVAGMIWSVLVSNSLGLSILLSGMFLLLSSSLILQAVMLDMRYNESIENHIRH